MKKFSYKTVNSAKKSISLLLFMAVLVSPLVLFGQSNHRLEKSFKVQAGGTLELESDLGSVEIKTGSNNTVDIEVIRRVDSDNQNDVERILKRFEVNFSQNNNTVVIDGDYDGHDSWGNRHNRLRVKYFITVPHHFNLDLATAGGSISVEDLKGEVKAKTAGGSLTFGDIDGPVWARTAGGSIRLDGAIGTADVKTAGGSLDIGDVSGNVFAKTAGGSIRINKAGGNVEAHTSGGSIDVEEVLGNIDASTSGGSVEARIAKQPKGNCSLETSGGSITVYLADDIGINLDAKSSWGKVRSDFPVKGDSGEKKSRLRGEINGGGPTLHLRNSSGTIRIRKI